jgi:anti-sigma factor RsiW
MTDSAKHLGATLQDFLDDRLDPARRAEVQTHLEDCARCRAELEALRWARNVARKLPGEEVPPALAERVSAALDAADRGARAGTSSDLVRRRWRKRAGFGALVAAALVLLLSWPPKVDITDAVARDFEAYSSGALQLDLRSSKAEAVESLFVAGGIDSRTRVFDLGGMQYQLVGGSIHRLNDRLSALFAYEGPGGRDLVCQMYQGRMGELPPADEVRQHGGVTFRVYRAGRLTLVFWQEGTMVCVLASDAEFEEVIRLAYAKAVKV